MRFYSDSSKRIFELITQVLKSVVDDNAIDNDVIQKTIELNSSDNLMSKYTHKDISHTMKASDNGVIDKVMVSTNLDGETFVKVRTRSVRIPEMGDKLASTHGQKGTIGMLYPQEDMPFTKDGATPDIIVNKWMLK